MYLEKRFKGMLHIPDGIVNTLDPGFSLGAPFSISNIKVQPGDYSCRYYICRAFDEKDRSSYLKHKPEDISDGDYLAKRLEMERKTCFRLEIQKKHHAYSWYSPKWQEIGVIDVESGLAGFFPIKPEYEDEEWSEFVNKTYDRPNSFVWNRDNSFYSVSGYGDGLYGVYGIKEKGEYVALAINF